LRDYIANKDKLHKFLGKRKQSSNWKKYLLKKEKMNNV
jgi:hypothetical protein